MNSLDAIGMKVCTGSFTLSAKAKSYEVTHNLGVVPTIVSLSGTRTFYASDKAYRVSGFYANGEGHSICIMAGSNFQLSNMYCSYDLTTSSPTSTAMSCYGVVAYNANESTITFGNENDPFMYLYGTYNYVIIGGA